MSSSQSHDKICKNGAKKKKAGKNGESLHRGSLFTYFKS